MGPAGAPGDEASTGETRIRKPVVVQQEGPPSGKGEALRRWNAARSAFLAAAAEMKDHLEHMEAGRKAANELPSLVEQREEAHASSTEAEAAMRAAESRVGGVRSRHQEAETLVKKAAAAVAAHRDLRPGLISRIFRLQAARGWNLEAGKLKVEHDRHLQNHAAEAEAVASADAASRRQKGSAIG